MNVTTLLNRKTSAEIQAEIDREVVDFVNANSTILPDTVFTADSTDGTGRWEIEKYRREVIRISKEAAQIGIDTKRGQGNTLLVSPKVATMLEQVGKFKVADVEGGVRAPISGGVAGIFEGGVTVVIESIPPKGLSEVFSNASLFSTSL